MTSTDEPDGQGPKLVWTFPLITRLQSSSRFIDIGSNIQEVTDNSSLGERVSNRKEKITDRFGGSEDETDEVQDEIDEIRQSSEDVFDSDYGEDSDDEELNLDYSQEDSDSEVHTVDIQGGTFIPQRVNIDEGDVVKWVNNDDSTRKITSTEGEEFSSGALDNGESFEHQFDEEGTVVYVDSIEGGEDLSGAVIVGDSEPPDQLPSETEQERVTFNSSTRSMSKAAEEKEDMEVGF